MSLRTIIATAALAVAPLLTAVPAGALTAGSTVCYAADGTAVVNPPNPDDYENCYTRSGSGGSGGGGNTPYLCTVTAAGYKNCTPILPLQG